MPTPECLEERSKAILDKLDDMDERYSQVHSEIRYSIQKTAETLDQRISRLEAFQQRTKVREAHERGKRQGILWAGGVALATFSAIFGAIGNILYSWIVDRLTR